jgi:signal transduction histidine kinase
LIVAPPETPELRESAWKQGRDDEHERILKLFHDDVSPKLLAAVFAAQVAKEELEASGLPAESTTVAKIGDQLVEAIEGVADALEPEEAKKIPD